MIQVKEFISDHPIQPYPGVIMSRDYTSFGTLTREDTQEQFELTRRTFDSVDSHMGFKIGMLVAYYEIVNSGRPVNILDAGAGFDFNPALELARDYGASVNVTAIDLASETDMPEETSNFHPIRGDIANLSEYVADGTMDLVYSFQLFPYLRPQKEPLTLALQRRWELLLPIVKTLRPNGTALIHDRSGSFITTQAYRLAAENGLDIVHYNSDYGESYRITRVPTHPHIQALVPEAREFSEGYLDRAFHSLR